MASMAAPLVIAIAAAAAAILLPLLYAHAATSAQHHLPTLRNRRICLLIAHPDDEAMFFSPTLLALTRPDTGNHVRILCLSTGDAEGLGETRRRELVRSGALLGVKEEADVLVVDDGEHFPDSMEVLWDAERISNLLWRVFVKGETGATTTTTEHKPSIDVLVTFDSQGISSHPNHISLYHGARAFVSSLPKPRPSSSSADTAASVTLYTLRTVGLVRKYASILDGFLTKMFWRTEPYDDHDDDSGDRKQLLFMNHLRGEEKEKGGQVYGRGYRAMTEAHVSQMRWFRYGWILLSRYMVVNELVMEECA